MLTRTLIFAALVCALAAAAEYRGSVKSSGLPIPGATVTATQGAQKLATSTDESGVYVFPNLAAGNWTIEVEMMGFGTVSKTVPIGDTVLTGEIELKIQSPQAPARDATPAAVAAQQRPERRGPNAERRPPAASAALPGGINSAAPRQGAAGFQRLEVTQTAQSELQQALNAPPPEPATQELAQNANESFLVNGSLSQGLQAPQRMDDAFAQQGRFDGMRGGPDGGGGMPGAPGGGFGGPGGGGPGGRGGGGFGGPGGGGFGGRGGPGGDRGRGDRGDRGPRGATTFGNRSNRGRDGFHGGASFSLRNSALDAKSYSLSGQDIRKASYAQSRFSLMGGGALRIPHLFTDEKTFIFVNYFGSRSRNPYDNIATVPSLLERTGDFSQSFARGPVTIFDPLTQQPFAGNRIPPSRINPASLALLNLFPLPNQPGAVQNYQIVSSVPQNSDNLGLRLNRTITKKDRLSGSFNMQHRDGSSLALFGFRDASSGRGISTDISWSRNIMVGLISNFRVNFSRNSSTGLPYFAYGTDWARQLAIAGTSADPINYGPPNLSFTNFGGLSDGSPSQQVSQTAGFSEGLIRVKGKHTLSFGFEYRRMQQNSISDSNARGSYLFSGLGTSGFDAAGQPLANTGFDFADYLLGLPNSSSIRFGSSDLYFRSSAYTAYASEDWRILSNLTINVGLRYEYLTPLHEKYGRMANLDIAPNFAAVAVVTPATPGPYTGAFPDGLVNPDKNNFAPRFGLSWKPMPKKQTLVRLGYGWYYNGSVYNAAASRMAQQPPFAKTYSVNTSLARPLTIQQGFLAVTAQQITNTYAIDRNYLIGYAQTWNIAIQQNLPYNTVMEVGYLGTKGTRLDVQRLPNRAAPGSPLTSEQRRLIGNATGFTFDTSDGNSIYHAGQLRLTRRFRRGISGSALYTFSKSIDDASSIGGGGAVVVQDDHNLAAERALSTFDRRHNLNLNFMFSTSGSPNSFASKSVLLRDWQLTGGIIIRSGPHFTPTVLGNRSDAGGSGAVGSSRADATGLPVSLDGLFFNPAAFALPPAARYGNASRNSITGPTMFAANMSFGRTIRFGETRRSADIRAEANNVFNTVNITGVGATVNSSNYGLALNAGAMRSITLNLRLRF